MIIACSILTSNTSFILPSLLFIGILSGIMKNNSMNETLITTLIAFIIGSIFAFIISLITVYYTYGGLYAIAVVQYSVFNILIYIIIGCIGGALGYYVSDEI